MTDKQSYIVQTAYGPIKVEGDDYILREGRLHIMEDNRTVAMFAEREWSFITLMDNTDE